MDPSTIHDAIKLAELAVDAAAKVKNHFFSSSSDSKTSSSQEMNTSATLVTLQTNVNLLKIQFDEVANEVADNKKIIQEQNEIIIGLSNALKVTAENAKRLRMIGFAALALSVVSILAVFYVILS